MSGIWHCCSHDQHPHSFTLWLIKPCLAIPWTHAWLCDSPWHAWFSCWSTRLRLWNLPTAPWPTATALVLSSLHLHLTAVPCSVVGPFLWLDRWSGTRYQTTYKIRRVLLTVFVVIWKLFFSRFTSVLQRIRGLAIMRYTNSLLTLTLTLTKPEQIMVSRHAAECMTTDLYIGHSMDNHCTIGLYLLGMTVVLQSYCHLMR